MAHQPLDALLADVDAVREAQLSVDATRTMADHMRSELVIDALQMVLARRRPRPGLIHHSDQGSQFVSLTFGMAARDAGIAVSMGRRGDAYDNAVAESFFATLKKELIRRRSWPSRRELIGEVFEYIEAFYNPIRRHSTLGYLSPVDFETALSAPTVRVSPLRGSQIPLRRSRLKQQRPKQPCPLKRGHSTLGLGLRQPPASKEDRMNNLLRNYS